MHSRGKRTAGAAAILAGASLVTVTAGATAANATPSRTATVRADAGRVSASGISGKWIYTYKSPKWTSHVQSHGKVQMCFNVTGNRLSQGYVLQFLRRVGAPFPHTVIMWSQVYWGAKHKTCTGWKSGHHDKVWAAILPYHSPKANANAQIWIYNP